MNPETTEKGSTGAQGRPDLKLDWKRLGTGRIRAEFEHNGQWLIASIYRHQETHRYVWDVSWESPKGIVLVALGESLTRHNAKAVCKETMTTLTWFAREAEEVTTRKSGIQELVDLEQEFGI